MKLEIKSNFSFSKLASNISSILDKQSNRISKGSAQDARENIDKGLSPPLKKSTLSIRDIRNIEGSKPLYATGRLYKSIKDTKDGIQMMKYGLYHHKGFTPKKIPFALKYLDWDVADKMLGYANNKKGIRVPARPFLFPSQKTILKSIDAFKRDLRKGMRK